MRHLFRNLLADESGATAIEYCLIAITFFLAIVLLVPQIGLKVKLLFQGILPGLQ